MVKELDDASFKELVGSGKTVLVDFWASWCGPCRALAPVLDELSKDEEVSSKVEITKLSTEKFPQIAQESHVTGIPCLIIYRDGKELNRIVGFAPKDALKQKILGIVG